MTRGSGLSAQAHGANDSLTYVAYGAPGVGHIERGVDNVVADLAPLPDGIIAEAQVSMDIECAARGDTWLEYRFELATLIDGGPVSAVEFSDVTGTVTRSCKASGTPM